MSQGITVMLAQFNALHYNSSHCLLTQSHFVLLKLLFWFNW